MNNENIPLLDCPIDFIMGEASGKILNEYGRFPCKIKCGVYAFIVQGTASATINITRHEVTAHDAMYITPGSFLLIHEFSEDAKVFYIVFSSSFLERNMYGMRNPTNILQGRNPIVHLNDEQAVVANLFSNLLTEAVNCTPSLITTERMVHIFSLLLQMFCEHSLHDENATQSVDRKTEIYQEYSNLVMSHYHEWHHVSDYAAAMRLSTPHLCSTIKTVCGRTAGDLIIDAILMDAKAQLKITTVPIKEIAMQLGFNNVAFFNRFFKSHTGQTPKAYRQM